MVGKSNIPLNAVRRPDIENVLDHEREASMADEGGAAGAEIERQAPEESGPQDQFSRPSLTAAAMQSAFSLEKTQAFAFRWLSFTAGVFTGTVIALAAARKARAPEVKKKSA